MLPNLATLAPDVSATSAPARQAPPSTKKGSLPDANGRAYGPSLTKALPDELLRKILLAIDADDAKAACRTVDAWCGADTDLKAACADRSTWAILTERVFKSTEVDRALFAHDALLETNPKMAFKKACYDRQIAHAVGIKFLGRGLNAVKRRLFSDWQDGHMEVEREDDPNDYHPVSRDDVHRDEGWPAIAVMDAFYEAYPVAQKFAEWRLRIDDEYPKKKVTWFDSDAYRSVFPNAPLEKRAVMSLWRFRANVHAQLLGFEKRHIHGEGPVNRRDWFGPMTPVHVMGWYELVEMARTALLKEQTETWGAYFERVDELVHGLAERVGLATVWMWHTSLLTTTDDQFELAIKCVRAFPDTHLPVQ